MKNKKIEDIGRRASKTFIQAFLSSLAITLPTYDFTQEGVWKSVLIGAIASGLSATMNYVSNLLNGEEEKEMATTDERPIEEIEETGTVEGGEE